MDIRFRTKKLARTLSSEKGLAGLGTERARKLKLRLAELRAADNLGDLGPPFSPPGRCQELKGDRAGQLSVDLGHPYRLIFVPAPEPAPQRKEGGLDWTGVTAIMIRDVKDTHD